MVLIVASASLFDHTLNTNPNELASLDWTVFSIFSSGNLAVNAYAVSCTAADYRNRIHLVFCRQVPYAT